MPAPNQRLERILLKDASGISRIEEELVQDIAKQMRYHIKQSRTATLLIYNGAIRQIKILSELVIRSLEIPEEECDVQVIENGIHPKIPEGKKLRIIIYPLLKPEINANYMINLEACLNYMGSNDTRFTHIPDQ